MQKGFPSILSLYFSLPGSKENCSSNRSESAIWETKQQKKVKRKEKKKTSKKLRMKRSHVEGKGVERKKERKKGKTFNEKKTRLQSKVIGIITSP